LDAAATFAFTDCIADPVISFFAFFLAFLNSIAAPRAAVAFVFKLALVTEPARLGLARVATTPEGFKCKRFYAVETRLIH
jgi:hypothetical protein